MIEKERVRAIAGSFSEAVLAAETRIFTRPNTLVGAVLWLAVNLTLFSTLFFNWHWPYIPKEFSTGCVDFGWSWISGRLAALHEPNRIFDYASFASAQSELFGAGRCTVLWSFPYPPTLLFFTYPFGLFPFVTAYVLWTIVLTVFFLGAVHVIVRRVPAVVSATAMKPAVINLYLGQNAFLTGGLLGFALTVLERRPVAAGFLVALLTYKPQYGLLIPIALIASRNWRALASAIGFSLVLAGAAALAFGSDGWSSFLFHLAHRDPYLSQNPGFSAHHYSVYGVLQSSGFGPATAWTAHAAVVVFLGLVVWRVWSKPCPYPIRTSLLCVASVLATPYLLYYDLSLLVIPFAFLVKEGLQRGFLAGERSVMAICLLAVGESAYQIGWLVVCAALLLLLYRRIVALRRPGAEFANTQRASGERPAFEIA